MGSSSLDPEFQVLDDSLRWLGFLGGAFLRVPAQRRLTRRGKAALEPARPAAGAPPSLRGRGSPAGRASPGTAGRAAGPPQAGHAAPPGPGGAWQPEGGRERETGRATRGEEASKEPQATASRQPGWPDGDFPPSAEAGALGFLREAPAEPPPRPSSCLPLPTSEGLRSAGVLRSAARLGAAPRSRS